MDLEPRWTGRKLWWRKEFDKMFFHDLPLRLLFQLLVLWIKLLQKTLGPLSLAAISPHVFSEKGCRTQERSSQLSFHDDSLTLYGHPTGGGGPPCDGAEASAWDPSHSKAHSDFTKREIHVRTVLRPIWVTRLHGKE